MATTEGKKITGPNLKLFFPVTIKLTELKLYMNDHKIINRLFMRI